MRASAPALVDALSRVDEVRAIGAGRLDLSGLPTGRVKVLARYAAAARAQAIARMPEQRRIATLLAFAHLLEATAHAQGDHEDAVSRYTESLALYRQSATSGCPLLRGCAPGSARSLSSAAI